MIFRKITAEFLGTALLLAIVIGSGIMGERLAQGNAAIALLANTIATGVGLFTLITVFGPISGAHFNPVVTLAALLDRALTMKDAGAYLAAQFAGGCLGAILAHAMFGMQLLQTSRHARGTVGEALGELVATFGLILTIRMSSRAPLPQMAAAVALWITSAYWFTSSTGFANPAVTLARSLTDTFAGIAPANILLFVAFQILGASLAFLLANWFVKGLFPTAECTIAIRSTTHMGD